MVIKVNKSKDNPESTEILAEAIVRIGEAMDKLNKSGLNRNAIIVLIHDATKLPKRDIRIVLDSLSRLRGWYCKK